MNLRNSCSHFVINLTRRGYVYVIAQLCCRQMTLFGLEHFTRSIYEVKMDLVSVENVLPLFFLTDLIFHGLRKSKKKMVFDMFSTP